MNKKRGLGLAIAGIVVAVGIVAVITSVSDQQSVERQSAEDWIGIMESNLRLCQLVGSPDDLQDLNESLNMELPVLHQETPRFTDQQVLQLNSIADQIDACLEQKTELYVP